MSIDRIKFVCDDDAFCPTVSNNLVDRIDAEEKLQLSANARFSSDTNWHRISSKTLLLLDTLLDS